MPAGAALIRNDDSPPSEMPDRKDHRPEERLTALVRQLLEENSITRPFSASDQLSAVGLSSLDMVRLMLSIEAHFGVSIPATDITPANFFSIATIEALLARLR